MKVLQITRITKLSMLCMAAVATNPPPNAKAELHPIVGVQTGYLFGATANGKWMKAEEAAKPLDAETIYRIYGLTQSLGEAMGAKPKPSEEDVCSDVLAVSLSPKPEKGTIALAAPWNALPRKPQMTDRTQKTYVDADKSQQTSYLAKLCYARLDNFLRRTRAALLMNPVLLPQTLRQQQEPKNRS